MGFNFGAFAGGAAKAGVDTYFRLGEEERRDAEAKRLQELHDAKMAEIQKENELDKAYADTLGRAGTPEAWRTAGGSRGPQEEGAQPALSANPTEAFPTQKLYSRDQAMQDYRNKIMGISATKGAEVLGKMQGLEKGELEIDAYKRAAKKEAAFDTYMNTLKDKIPALRDEVQSELKTNGISGTVTKYGSEFTKLTGHTASVIGNELVIKDAKGKVIERLSDHDDILNGLTDVLGKRIQHNAMQGMLTAGVFTNAKDLQEFYKTKSTIGYQEAHGAALTSQAASEAALVPSKIALNTANAAYARAHAGAIGEGKVTDKLIQVDLGKDKNGQPLGKMPITISISRNKDKVPVVTAYDLNGQKITDPTILKAAQARASEGDTATTPVDSKFGALRASVIGNKDMTVEEKFKALNEIDTMEKLPPAGQAAGITKAKPSAALPTTSGSHAPIGAPTTNAPLGGLDTAQRVRLKEINERLQLEGTSEENKLRLMLERDAIMSGKSRTSGLTRFSATGA